MQTLFIIVSSDIYRIDQNSDTFTTFDETQAKQIFERWSMPDHKIRTEMIKITIDQNGKTISESIKVA